MMKGGLAGLMKQAQVMQENMKKGQEQLAQIEVEGQAGAAWSRSCMTCARNARCAARQHRPVGRGLWICRSSSPSRDADGSQRF
jgi:hypothetical protein